MPPGPSHLRRAAALLAASNDPDAQHTAACLSRLLAGEDPKQALGLVGNWQDRARLAARDEALRRVRAEMLPDITVNAAAAEIASAARGLRAALADTEQARRLATLRPRLRARLAELGALDVPGQRRLRQVLTSVSDDTQVPAEQ